VNAFNTVNLAAACVLTSVEQAEKLRIPREKWVYVLGGAGTEDRHNCESTPVRSIMDKWLRMVINYSQVWERPWYWTSPALEKSIDTAIKVSGLTLDELDVFDFYS